MSSCLFFAIALKNKRIMHVTRVRYVEWFWCCPNVIQYCNVFLIFQCCKAKNLQILPAGWRLAPTNRKRGRVVQTYADSRYAILECLAITGRILFFWILPLNSLKTSSGTYLGIDLNIVSTRARSISWHSPFNNMNSITVYKWEIEIIHEDKVRNC